MVLKTTKLIQQVRRRLQTAQRRQKSYADRSRLDLVFQVGDMVLLKVLPWKVFIEFRKQANQVPRYIGPFLVSARVCRVTYSLDLPYELI